MPGTPSPKRKPEIHREYFCLFHLNAVSHSEVVNKFVAKTLKTGEIIGEISGEICLILRNFYSTLGLMPALLDTSPSFMKRSSEFGITLG